MKYAIRFVVLCCFASVPNIACAQETRPSATQPGAGLREPTTQDWKDLAAEMEAFRKNPPKTEEDMVRARALHAKLAGMALLEAKSDFRLKGEVVDESGKRMEGVKMTITRSMAPHMAPGPEVVGGRSETEEKTIDGTFDVTAQGWWGVGITFTKQGYEPEQIELTSHMDQRSVQQMLEQRGVEPSTVVKEGLKIEMVKRPVPSATVVKGRQQLMVQADGSGQYAIFGKPRASEDREGNNLFSGDLKKLPANGELPKDAFTVEEAAQDGKFLPSTKKSLPDSITLRLNASGGGILLFEPHRLDYGLRILKEAPADGYAQEIILKPEDMVKIGRQRGLFFFFKTADGKYGKGSLKGTFGMKSGKAEFYVRMYLQTDGTRNVQSAD